MSSLGTRLLQRTLRSSRLIHTKNAPPSPPPEPHPFLSQINLASGSSSRLADTDRAHVGPFPLPAGDRDAQVRAAGTKWKELGTGQKVGWAATQTSSLFVVLAGGGLAVLVLYATGTELWSEASPTRIFEDCVERVRACEELQTVLLPPLTFHGANSSNRLRRNRRISSTITTDPFDGSETMHVRFWVEGRVANDGDDETWWDTVKKWVGPAIWEDSTKPGSYVPRPSVPKSAPPPPAPEPDKSWAGWLAGGFASAFEGIVPRVKVGQNGEVTTGAATMFRRAKRPALGEYSTAECVAELKKDPTTGNFVYRQLYVAIPDTRHPNPYRINISTDVEGEPQKGWDRLRFWHRTRTVA